MRSLRPRCQWCGERVGGRPPTWRQPRRCSRCGVLVWPNDLYSYERDTPLRTNLGSRKFPAAVSHMGAEIKANGDLVLDFQDFGPAVDAIWGGGDYEYWVTVPATRLRTLIRRLAKELNARSITLAETDVLESESTEEDVGRLTLVLVRTAFAEDIFTTATEFRDWLKRNRIRSSFASY